MHKVIHSDKAVKAVGPYSQAIMAQGTAITFISGQIPLDPLTMLVVSDDVREQTQAVLKNLQAILDAVFLKKEHVVKTTVYLKDMNDFCAINEEYEKFFTNHKPARACVEVARLPKDVLVEIDAIAIS